MNILVAGDYCPQERVAKQIENGNFEIVFGQVRPIVANSDYSLVNLECPVRTTKGDIISKVGPILSCSSSAISALKYAGFKCVTLANNHFLDQGEEGVKETIEVLSREGIDFVGGGKNEKCAAQILYRRVDNKTLAVINCCEHEFSIATKTSGGSNPLNPILQYRAIQDAKSKADYILVIVHGGIEHFQYPSKRMVETYRFFIEAGADAVVNHHQHCICGYEVYKGKPIFYGLGNFCFDWAKRSTSLWKEGLMVMLRFNENSIGFSLIPYIQNGGEVGVSILNPEEYLEWKLNFDIISKVITDENKLEEKYKELLVKTERNYSSYLTPYTSRIMLALYRRRFLPLLIPKSKRLLLLNMFLCESHYDRMVHMLRHYSE